jgi:hypothetical protein
MCVIVMYKLSVGHAKIFCDFFASMASFRQNLAELSANSVDNSVNSAEFHISKNFMVLSHVSCNSTEFSRFSPIFFEFCKMRRIRQGTNFPFPPNFVTLPPTVALFYKNLSNDYMAQPLGS